VRIALGLEYDGSPYEGWQTQPHGRTVQDVLERALASFANESLATICAGRTDTGVHASGQVVHFNTECERDQQSWVRGVNRFLPPSVSIQWARTVDAQFDARHRARTRHYEYWIWNHPVRSALLDRRVGWVFRPMDQDAMQAAARHVLGEHDFSSLRSAQCQAATAIRTISRCEVDRVGPSLIRIRTSANAFLHHMVRNLVGALVAVGTGRQHSAWLGELIAARDRTLGAPTMEADGLYLTGVEYDPHFGLPQVEERWIFR
jgi:tRNA pseudouridine38-40 synthase